MTGRWLLVFGELLHEGSLEQKRSICMLDSRTSDLAKLAWNTMKRGVEA